MLGFGCGSGGSNSAAVKQGQFIDSPVAFADDVAVKKAVVVLTALTGAGQRPLGDTLYAQQHFEGTLAGLQNSSTVSTGSGNSPVSAAATTPEPAINASVANAPAVLSAPESSEPAQTLTSKGGPSSSGTAPLNNTTQGGTTSSSGGNSVGPYPYLYYAGMDPDVLANIPVGQTISVGFKLDNRSNIDANGYKLKPVNPAFGTGTSFPTFSIPAWSIGTARVLNLTVPEVPLPRIEFVIQDSNGCVLSDITPV